jgi:hypothetical protein
MHFSLTFLTFFNSHIDFQNLEKICLQIFLCGSGSALDPESKILWNRIAEKCWIRIESIRINNPA